MVEPIKLDVQWSPDFQSRTEAGFKRLQKEADGEFLRLVTPYVPKRTGALAGSAKTSTVLGSGEIRHTAPYAAAQYYRLPCGQGVREDGRGPYWGERCVNDHREEFIAFVKTRAKEVTK